LRTGLHFWNSDGTNGIRILNRFFSFMDFSLSGKSQRNVGTSGAFQSVGSGCKRDGTLDCAAVQTCQRKSSRSTVRPADSLWFPVAQDIVKEMTQVQGLRVTYGWVKEKHIPVGSDAALSLPAMYQPYRVEKSLFSLARDSTPRRATSRCLRIP